MKDSSPIWFDIGSNNLKYAEVPKLAIFSKGYEKYCLRCVVTFDDSINEIAYYFVRPRFYLRDCERYFAGRLTVLG